VLVVAAEAEAAAAASCVGGLAWQAHLASVVLASVLPAGEAEACHPVSVQQAAPPVGWASQGSAGQSWAQALQAWQLASPVAATAMMNYVHYDWCTAGAGHQAAFAAVAVLPVPAAAALLELGPELSTS